YLKPCISLPIRFASSHISSISSFTSLSFWNAVESMNKAHLRMMRIREASRLKFVEITTMCRHRLSCFILKQYLFLTPKFQAHICDVHLFALHFAIHGVIWKSFEKGLDVL